LCVLRLDDFMELYKILLESKKSDTWCPI
jgi:hypothetical protein